MFNNLNKRCSSFPVHVQILYSHPGIQTTLAITLID